MKFYNSTTPNYTRHAYCLCVITFCAALSVFFHLTGKIFIDWADGVAYEATAKNLWLFKSFMPTPLTYVDFMASGSAAFGDVITNYPNYAFSSTLGFLGAMRGDFSLLNGVILGGIFTIGLGLVCYALLYEKSRNSVLSTAFAIMVLYHHTILDISGRPLSDMVLLFFWGLSLLCVLKEHHILSGLVLGVGYLFREHALMFLPFLSFFSPQANSFKGLCRVALLITAGFLPAIAGKMFFYSAYATKTTEAKNYYLGTYATWIDQWFSMESITRFLKNNRRYWSNSGITLRIMLLFALLRIRFLPPLVQRAMVVGIILWIIPCFMWTTQRSVPVRYIVYSVLLFNFALALCVMRLPKREYIYVSLVILTILIAPPKRINKNSLTALFSPVQHMTEVVEKITAPMKLQTVLPEKATILTDSAPLAYMTLNAPVAISTPTFAEFAKTQGNEQLDGILLRRGKGRDGWNYTDTIVDNYGVRFKKITLDNVPFPERHAYYKRITP